MKKLRRFLEQLTSNGKVPLRVILSWALYDTANSAFQLGIISLYYVLWIVQDMGVKEIYYSLALALAQMVIILSAPFLGAFSDKHHKKRIIFIFFTLECILFTTFLGTHNIMLSLLFFSLAFIGFQIGQIFYDSFLVDISTKENRGLISGIGIALGQVGYVLVILLMAPIVVRYGRSASFIPSALMFLVLCIPALILLKERTPAKNKSKETFRIKSTFKRVLTTLRNLKKYPGAIHFLISRFFYLDALHTVYIFAAVYCIMVLKFTDIEVQFLAAFLLVFAALGALSSGFFISRFGPKRFLGTTLIILTLGLCMLALTNSKTIVWLFGIILGLAEGFVWSVDRVIITRISPRKQIGEFFGLYGIMSRLSAMVGPLLWGGIVLVFAGLGLELARRIAMLSLVGLFVVAIIAFLPLKIPEGEI